MSDGQMHAWLAQRKPAYPSIVVRAALRDAIAERDRFADEARELRAENAAMHDIINGYREFIASFSSVSPPQVTTIDRALDC